MKAALNRSIPIVVVNKAKACMLAILDHIPYGVLIVFTLVMLMLPFYPMPHVLEKLIMLKNGTLKRPLDIFDLLYHCIPLILLVLKIIRDQHTAN